MKMSLLLSKRRSGGFAIKELIVVLAVVAVLAVLAILAIGSARERSLRANCRNNLMQIGAALKDYTQANSGALPDCSPANPQFFGAAWPWDISTNLVSELMQRGVSRNSFYCPANPAMNDLSHWEFWRFTHSSIRVISYGTLFNGQGQIPAEFWRKDLSGSGSLPPSQTELGFDATVSMRGDFAHIVGNNTDRSNHTRGSRPKGGNVLFEDMHVEWRGFSQMQRRFSTIPNAAWYF
jgi:Tfp pilus assembly protein PilE